MSFSPIVCNVISLVSPAFTRSKEEQPSYGGRMLQSCLIFIHSGSDSWADYQGCFKLENVRHWTAYVSYACACMPDASWSVLTCPELLCERRKIKDGSHRSKLNALRLILQLRRKETLPPFGDQGIMGSTLTSQISSRQQTKDNKFERGKPQAGPGIGLESSFPLPQCTFTNQGDWWLEIQNQLTFSQLKSFLERMNKKEV